MRSLPQHSMPSLHLDWQPVVRLWRTMTLAACLPVRNSTNQSSKLPTFDGLSGYVQFDPETGTRISTDVPYGVDYISLLDEGQEHGQHRFQSNLVAVIRGDNITETKHPFLYNDNGIYPPPPIPPVAEDMSLMPIWTRVIGYCLGGLLICLSVACFAWTVQSRKKVDVLIMAQPFFLCQLCVGAFILAFAVFPMSLPGASTIKTTTSTSSSASETESTLSMDIACMSSIWLILIGFSIAFSSLASKIYRVGQVVACGTQYQRATVSVRHVMAPLYISLTFNITMLLCLTFLAPLQCERVQMDNYDSFGRSTSSYGSCQPANSHSNKLLVAMAVINTLGVVYVAHLAYKEREFPDDFSDLKSLSLATLSLLETLLIGLPVLLAARNDPTVLYLAASGMVCVPFMVILLLVFVPKYQMRKRKFDFRTLGRALSQCSGSNLSLGSKSSYHSDYKRPSSHRTAMEGFSSPCVSTSTRQSGRWDGVSEKSWGQSNVRRINRNSITVR